jgi:rhodanese-related sulfurtransferase
MDFWQQYHNVIIMIGIFTLFIFKGKIMGYFFGFKSVSAKVASAALRSSKGVLLDVRTDAEFQTGHVAGAKHIPLHQLSGHLPALAKELKGKEVYVICHTGGRSASACVALAKMGLEVYNVTGGMVGWNVMGDKSLLARQ